MHEPVATIADNSVTNPGDTPALALKLPEKRAVAHRTGLRWLLRDLFRNRPAQLGGLIVLVLVVAALFAPWLAPYNPYAINVKDRLQPPNAIHFFGTDDLGRDLFSRIIYGARTTIQTGLVVILIAASSGTLIGVISGYYGGLTDLIVMRIIDVGLAFPYILLALAIVATIGPSLQNALIAIGLAYVPGWARYVRGSVLALKQNEYVIAAQATGARDSRIIWRHILTNIISSIIVLASLDFPAAVLSTAALSYVGLGAQPPSAEWGSLLTGARSYMRTASWLVNFPGLAIFITMLGFNLLGNALRDVLDPKLRRR
jgi:peptide/nickel transport system permease protein